MTDLPLTDVEPAAAEGADGSDPNPGRRLLSLALARSGDLLAPIATAVSAAVLEPGMARGLITAILLFGGTMAAANVISFRRHGSEVPPRARDVGDPPPTREQRPNVRETELRKALERAATLWVMTGIVALAGWVGVMADVFLLRLGFPLATAAFAGIALHSHSVGQQWSLFQATHGSPDSPAPSPLGSGMADPVARLGRSVMPHVYRHHEQTSDLLLPLPFIGCILAIFLAAGAAVAEVRADDGWCDAGKAQTDLREGDIPDPWGVALARHWYTLGAPEAGCPVGPARPIGTLWVADLEARDGSDGAMISSDGRAAWVSPRAGLELLDRIRAGEISMLWARARSGWGDHQVYADTAEMCRVLVRSHEGLERLYTDLPAAVTSAVLPLIADEGYPSVTVVETVEAGAQVTYHLHLVDAGGELTTDSITYDTTADLARTSDGSPHRPQPCDEDLVERAGTAAEATYDADDDEDGGG